MSSPEDPPARLDFHLALAGIVVPFAAFVVSTLFALKHLQAGGGGPAQAAWTRRLVALAAVDLLVLLALGVFAVGKVPVPVATAHPPRPRIGVVLDTRDRGEGAVVVSVVPGAPAEKVGIRPGDALTAIDGRAVRTNEDAIATIGATPPEGERAITLRRDGATVEVRVRPGTVADPKVAPAPLFAREGPREHARARVGGLVAAWAAAVVVLAGIAFVGARRGAALDPGAFGMWLRFAVALAAGHAALVGATLGVWRVVGGSSLGGALVGMVAGSGAIVVVAAVWWARLLRRGALRAEGEGEGDPEVRTGQAVIRGVGYLFAGLPRVGIVLAAAIPLLHLPEMDPGAEVRELLGRGLGPAGTALVVLGVVVLAPLGEETLFRGVLLPWLRRFLSPDAAAWASAWVFAIAHLRYGPHVLVVVVYGIVLAWARLATGRLRAPIALHAIINGAVLALAMMRG